MTEEVWSWWQDGSVHRAAWPTVEEIAAGGDPLVLAVAADVLGAVRKAKSEAKRLDARAGRARRGHRHRGAASRALEPAVEDVRNAGVVDELILEVGDDFSVVVTLADADS